MNKNEYQQKVKKYTDAIKKAYAEGNPLKAETIRARLKNFGNSVFPMDFECFYFYNPQIAEEITKRGRELMKKLENGQIILDDLR